MIRDDIDEGAMQMTRRGEAAGSRSSGLAVGAFSAFAAQFLLHAVVLTETNKAGMPLVFGCGALVLLVLSLMVLSGSAKAERPSSEPPWKMVTLTGWSVLGFLLVTAISALIFATSITTGQYVGFAFFTTGILSAGIGAVILALLLLLLWQINREPTR